MNLRERAVESYKSYAAARLERLKNTQLLLDTLEGTFGVHNPEIFWDNQGIPLAHQDGVYFYNNDSIMHVLIKENPKSEDPAVWTPVAALADVGRLVMMHDLGQLELAIPPQLHPESPSS